MFGDLFSTKTDLQLGLMYSSRRKFLVSAGKNVLEPPRDFKTKNQARRSIMNHEYQALLAQPPVETQEVARPRRRDSVVTKDALAFTGGGGGPATNPRLLALLNPLKKSISEGSNVSAPLRNFRKTAKFVMEAVIIEHYWEGNKDDWYEEDKAGVHYYVNTITGEVTTDCPWRPKFLSKENRTLTKHPSYKHLAVDAGEEEGTGSLVYDNTEVEELFSMLDDFDKKSPQKALPEKSTYSSPMKSAGLNIVGGHAKPR